MKAGHVLLLLIGFIAASHLRREMIIGKKRAAFVQQQASLKFNEQFVSRASVTFNQNAATIGLNGKTFFQRNKLNTQ
ncbi:MAG: hypothetical protein JNM68_06120 [Dinghuibacter sp.]|nr:hypothetical protein [Dinghuibacter sp.]